MSIASEITRLQGVKSDILQAIADKGVTIPTGSALDDCPGLIEIVGGYASNNRLYADYSDTYKGCFTPSFNLADAHIIEENIVFKASKWIYNSNFTLCGGQWYSGTTSKFIGIAVYCYADQIEFDWGDNVSANYDFVTGIPYDFSKIIRKNIVYDKNSGVATCKIYYDDVLVYTYTRATSDLYLWNDSSYSLLSNREHMLVEAGYIDLNKSYIRIDGKLVWGCDALKSESIIGGKRYKTVVMPDGKEWLAENLDFKFCNIGGDGTPATPNAWYYNNDEATYGIDGTRKCGLLYNWHAVKLLNDNRSDLIPGWHVPTNDEWTALANAVGGTSTAGTKLKAANVSWATSWGGTDDYGFAAFPAGGRYSGSFYNLGTDADFWTASEDSSTLAWNRYFGTGASMSSFNDDKTRAFSVRLVKDAT